MERFWVERKKEQREFPLLDVKLDQWRLWTLMIGLSVLMVLQVELSAAVDLANFWLETLVIEVIPAIIDIWFVLYVSQGELKKLFKHPHWSDWWFAFVILILQFIYSMISVSALNSLGFSTNKNAGLVQQAHEGSIGTAVFHSVSGDLFGLMIEEVVGLVIFLAIAAILIQYHGFKRRTALWIAMLGSMVVFGLLHYKVYNWNIMQMMFVIGVARLFLNSIYVRTKSIWVSWVVHLLFDTLGLIIAMHAPHPV